MQTGQHQRQEQPGQHCSHQQAPFVDSQVSAVGDGIRNIAAQRLQDHNRQRCGHQRGDQRIEDQLDRLRQPITQPPFNPAHQRHHQQHCNHPATARLQRLTEQSDLRQRRAGENTGHHAAHSLRTAKHPGGVNPDQNIHDGEHGAAKNCQQSQHVRVI
ncbi:hypothetical protein D3C80_1341120 [compost metagenome]